jgi:hypothetical protein
MGCVRVGFDINIEYSVSCGSDCRSVYLHSAHFEDCLVL